MLDKLKINIEHREKKSFWCSDFNKPLLDLYLAFKGVEPSNPIEWWTTLRFGAGTGLENAMLSVLKDSGIVEEDYDQKEHGRVEMERERVPITGYMDAVTKEGRPIEIKSINNKNSYDILKYRKGEPRENYVGQLCIYMDSLGVDVGYLFVSSVDGLERFWFECKKIGERSYRCGKIFIDLDKQYKRWSKLYSQNILQDIQPDHSEYLYKYPLRDIDWRKMSKNKIANARNNRGVIGDWEITYSPYKDLIIKLQKETLGYTDLELEFIREATGGYTTWN